MDAAENTGLQAVLKPLRTWVKRGLLEFWQTALPEDSVIVPLLRAAIERDWPASQSQTWVELTASLCASLKEQPLPLARLHQDQNLSTADLFLLALLGELQVEHSVNLAVSELQLPDKTPHLSVHLATALLDRLFPEDNPDWAFATRLLDKAFIRDPLVTLSRDAPLPLCKLQMTPVTWALLSGASLPWPGCTFIQAEAAGDLAQVSAVEAHTIASMLNRANPGPVTLVLRGVPDSGRRAFALRFAEELDLKALAVPAEVWQNQPALMALCPYVNWLPVVQAEAMPGTVFSARHSRGLLAVIVGVDGAVEGEHPIEVELQCPNDSERRKAWLQHLHKKALANQLGHSALLSLNSIRKLAGHARQLAERQGVALGVQHVKEARRYQGSEKLRLLAEPVQRQVTRDAMAFTASVQQGLDLLLLRARRREAIWKNLGKTMKVTPSPGVRALFAGDSGTGKTLAASYIATELGAPLYRVDLSAVMNKYIGESEKNLSQLLDHAAANDVVLLCDEADSLFGTRSEGKETGERFANMLTNFLLTRIENHPGVVILTTNGKERIDKAFNRRIDVEVNFPSPGYEERLALWGSHLGRGAIAHDALAIIASYCDFAGGQVRNAVLAAATYAGTGSLQLPHLLGGIRLEYNKVGRKVPVAIERLCLSVSESDS